MQTMWIIGIEDFVVVQATTLGEDKEEKQQRDDPSLGPIIKAKQSGTEPSQQKQKKGSPDMRQLYQLLDQFQLIRGVLYFPSGKSRFNDQLVVLKAMRHQILGDLHGGAFGRHLGEEKMPGKLKERFYWPG